MDYDSSKRKKLADSKHSFFRIVFAYLLCTWEVFGWGWPSLGKYTITYLLASHVIYVFNLPLYKDPGWIMHPEKLLKWSMNSSKLFPNFKLLIKNSKNYIKKASKFTWKPKATSSALHCMTLGVLVHKTWALVNSKGVHSPQKSRVVSTRNSS